MTTQARTVCTAHNYVITKEEWEDKEKRESCPEQGRRAFYQLLLYMAFSLLNSTVDTEVKSILGRADVVIKTDTHIFVLELKVDNTVENALAQIDYKGYAIPYETEGRTLVKCGVSISSEAQQDPKGPSSGSYRVYRGSSWGSFASYCRVASRDINAPSDRYDNLGFRLAL